jgi:diguanylate cyclase (GGDEF)-like protein
VIRFRRAPDGIADAQRDGGEHAPGLPGRAKAFLLAVGIAAAAVSAAAIAYGGVRPNWIAFVVLLIGASIVQLFAFHTIRNQVFHTTPLFLVAAAMLLPPWLLVLVPLISHLPDWIRKRYAWYIQTFNVLNFTLAIMCAWFAVRLIDGAPALSGRWAAGAAAAAAAYVVLNQAGFAVVLYLARGHRPGEILSSQVLSADASLACLGVALASFWHANAYLVPFALAPIVLLHFALHLPQLEEESRADAKTGLANARHYDEALTEELTRARRFSRPLSVVVADLDLLENVNATYGYLAGDAVLAGVADLIRSQLRQYDVGARISGAEFAVLLPETGTPLAHEIAERLREAVAGTPIWAESASQYVNVTLSVGVASFPTHGADPDDLLDHAGDAARRARLGGRNRVYRAARRPALSIVAPEPLIGAVVRDVPTRDLPPLDQALQETGRAPSRRVRLLAVAVAGAAVAGGAAAAVLGGSHDVRGLLATAGLVGVGQALSLEIDDGAISTGAVAALAGAAMFGLRGALALAAVSVAVDAVSRRWPSWQTLLSLGARTLSLLAAVGVFALALHGGIPDALLVVAGPVAGVASFVVTTAILTSALALDGRESWWRAWRSRFRWLVPHYAAYGFVAAVAAVAYREAGLYALAAFAVALLAIRLTQSAIVKQAHKNALNLRQATEMIQTQNLSLARTNRLLRQQSAVATSLSGMVDLHDAYTPGHSRRVHDFALAMGRELSLSDAELAVLGHAALFHDIGKLAVPESILLKRGTLTNEEWVVVRRHPDEGAGMIERLAVLADAVPAVRHHHERLDGTGYPAGLAGDEIPLSARIVHVADAYDAMRTNRIYREPRSSSEARIELRRNAATQFCIQCVDALERVLAAGTFAGETAGRADGSAADDSA